MLGNDSAIDCASLNSAQALPLLLFALAEPKVESCTNKNGKLSWCQCCRQSVIIKGNALR